MSAARAELAPLAAALDAAPAPVAFWWRDDDAGRPDPRLVRLLALAGELTLPLAVAVVPAWLEDEVRQAILACPQATVLQHGWAHESHAEPGERKVELGGSAVPAALAPLLDEGRRYLESSFGRCFVPVMVPPWNRMAPAVCAVLPGCGFTGVSLWRGTGIAPSPAGLRRIDTHIDLIDWRRGRTARPAGALAAELAEQVRGGPGGPLGILSHHLVMDESAFSVLRALLRLLRAHPRARLLGAGELFSEPP
ncbi:hypothetical protein SH611_10630 [Geminicoccaceae bacterium 1502E]|nr:hypothetical protein [Geminicoccaceae bacterium 1502E]